MAVQIPVRTELDDTLDDYAEELLSFCNNVYNTRSERFDKTICAFKAVQAATLREFARRADNTSDVECEWHRVATLLRQFADQIDPGKPRIWVSQGPKGLSEDELLSALEALRAKVSGQ